MVIFICQAIHDKRGAKKFLKLGDIGYEHHKPYIASIAMRLSHRSTQLWFKTSRPSQNTFICHRCRCLTQISQFTTTRQARASPEGPQKPDLTTRLRRRIWGTDTPPGQKDPYRRLTPEEKAAELLEQESVGDGKHNASHDTATEVARRQSAGEYLPAQNWDGLERIGGATGWWEEEWDRNNVYRGFLTEGVFGEKIANVEDVVRRVAVEILALKQAGVTLHECAQAEWSKEELIENIDIVKNEDGSFALREQTPDLIDELVEVLQSSPETDELETDELETEEMETDDLAEEIENPEEDPEAMEAEEQRLLDELNAEEEAAAAEEEQTPEEDEIPTVATTKTHDPIYLELPLTDIAFKFAVRPPHYPNVTPN